MSAFLVSRTHIDKLVTAWVNLGIVHRDHARFPIADEIGRMLWEENRKSIEHRYGKGDSFMLEGYDPEYTWSRVPFPSPYQQIPPNKLAAVAKLISCYVYQSCEHPGWEGSKAAEVIEQMRVEILSALPGYADSPWEARDLDA